MGRCCAGRARPRARYVIAQLDKFIGALFSKDAASLTLAAGQPPMLSLDGRAKPLMNQRPTAAQVRRLVAEITPATAQAQLKGSGRAVFEYDAPGGRVEVTVSAWGADTLVEVCRASETQVPPSLELELLPNGAPPPPSSVGVGVPSSLRGIAGPPPSRVNGGNGIGGAGGRARSSSTRPAALGPGSGRPIDRLFYRMVEEGASDLHLSSNETPMMRKDGDMVRLDGERELSAEALHELLEPIVPDVNRSEFERDNDTDFAYAIEGLARFRANLFRDRHGVGAVFRTIPAEIITAEKLGLSDAIKNLCNLHKGLVLVTGPTGSGKSTTLCGMVDLINRTRSGHIITIEDPIEFVHENKKCLVNQREIGAHTGSFKRALRAALREDPDVVLVGEMRDLETISIAIETAETGHLVFGTLHTTTAYSTIDRIIDQYPPDQQEQIRVMLSESLKGVVSQTLCKKIGGGRAAALEFLYVTPAVSNLIREGKTFQIPSIMQTSRNLGMRLLNEALIELVASKTVSPDEALSKAVDRTSLQQMLKSKNLI